MKRTLLSAVLVLVVGLGAFGAGYYHRHQDAEADRTVAEQQLATVSQGLVLTRAEMATQSVELGLQQTLTELALAELEVRAENYGLAVRRLGDQAATLRTQSAELHGDQASLLNAVADELSALANATSPQADDVLVRLQAVAATTRVQLAS